MRKLHGYPFYEQPLSLTSDDSAKLTALFSAPGIFQRFQSRKKCGGFDPDFCLEWKTDAATTRVISLECEEATLFGPTAK